MRYYIKCKLNPEERQTLADSLRYRGSLAQGKIFYEGMQTALREATIDENDVVHFIEIMLLFRSRTVTYGNGNYQILKKHFSDITEIKDARLRNQ